MTSYLPGLNTVRFLAALNVMIVHWAAYEEIPYLPVFSGANAVTIFFVLSGYLIAYRLLLEQRAMGRIHLKAFYIRRALRILPLYYLLMVIGGLILPLIGAPRPSGAALSLTLFLMPQMSYALGMPMGVMVQLWSVGVEELFYVTFPLALTRLSIPSLCLIVIGGATGLKVLAGALNSPLLALLQILRIECMAVGALVAWMVVTRVQGLTYIYHGWMQATSIVLLGLVAFFHLTWPLFDVTFSIIVAVFLVNLSTNPHALIRLEWHWARRAGEWSYGMYIWHLPILWIASQGLRGVPFLLISLATTLIVAAFSYRFIERPFLRLSPRTVQLKPILDSPR
jgi:peptidoglycan/LPS O-acetylase OafA/YrhL